MNKLKIKKYHVATFIALLFHVSGFIGMFTSSRDWFVANTPLNLLLMFGLLMWTHPAKNASFLAFVFIAFVTGMLTEMLGVNTGLLFGKYAYGKVLGSGINHVPWLIGLNWVTVVYCCGVSVSRMQSWLFSKSPPLQTLISPRVQFLSFCADGAVLATFFDFILEPVAVKLGYWIWLDDTTIPITNFLCWFLISAALLAVFRLLSFPKHNQFAVHLLIIEILFFYGLRTFL